MPKLSQLINVKVEDAGEHSQKRKIKLNIEADANSFSS